MTEPFSVRPPTWKILSLACVLLLGLPGFVDETILPRVALALLLFGAWIAPRRLRWPALGVAIAPCTAAVLVYVHAVWGSVVLAPDSDGYLGNWSSRSPGLYWITSALFAMFGSLDAFAALQGLAVVGAGILAAIALASVLKDAIGHRGALLLAGLMVLVTATSEQVWGASPQALTEALTAAGLLASVSLMVLALRRPDADTRYFLLVLLSAVVLGLAFLVRTTAVLAAPVLVLFLLRLGAARVRAAVAFTAPVVAAVFLQCGWSLHHHGHFGLPLLSGAALLGNVAPLMQPGDSDRHPAVSARISAYVDKIGARVDWSTSAQDRCEATVNRYNEVLWREGGAWHAVSLEVNETGTTYGAAEAIARNTVANRVAWDCIERHRFTYARFVLEHFVNFYRLASGLEDQLYRIPMESSAAAERLSAWKASSYTRNAAPEFSFPLLDAAQVLPSRLLLGYWWTLPATCIVPIVVLVRGRSSPAWMVFAAIALGVTALVLAGTAFYQVSLHRYVLPIQLLLCFANLALVAGLIGSAVVRWIPDRPSST